MASRVDMTTNGPTIQTQGSVVFYLSAYRARLFWEHWLTFTRLPRPLLPLDPAFTHLSPIETHYRSLPSTIPRAFIHNTVHFGSFLPLADLISRRRSASPAQPSSGINTFYFPCFQPQLLLGI